MNKIIFLFTTLVPIASIQGMNKNKKRSHLEIEQPLSLPERLNLLEKKIVTRIIRNQPRAKEFLRDRIEKGKKQLLFVNIASKEEELITSTLSWLQTLERIHFPDHRTDKEKDESKIQKICTKKLRSDDSDDSDWWI